MKVKLAGQVSASGKKWGSSSDAAWAKRSDFIGDGLFENQRRLDRVDTGKEDVRGLGFGVAILFNPVSAPLLSGFHEVKGTGRRAFFLKLGLFPTWGGSVQRSSGGWRSARRSLRKPRRLTLARGARLRPRPEDRGLGPAIAKVEQCAPQGFFGWSRFDRRPYFVTSKSAVAPPFQGRSFHHDAQLSTARTFKKRIAPHAIAYPSRKR